MARRKTVLAICGSLRARSSNQSVIQAAQLVAPPQVSIERYDDLGGLPYFNPDLDCDPLPASVVELRTRVRAADALLICSPEYAHGVPGVMKNALDWLVSSGELMEKPVSVINASPSSQHAHESLIETLTVLMAQIVEAASIALPLPRNSMTAEEIVADATLANRLREALDALAKM